METERILDKELVRRVGAFDKIIGGIADTAESFYLDELEGLSFVYEGSEESIEAVCKKLGFPTVFMSLAKEEDVPLWLVGGLFLSFDITVVRFYAREFAIDSVPLYVLPFHADAVEDPYVFFARQITRGEEYNAELKRKFNEDMIEVHIFESISEEAKKEKNRIALT